MYCISTLVHTCMHCFRCHSDFLYMNKPNVCMNLNFSSWTIVHVYLLLCPAQFLSDVLHVCQRGLHTPVTAEVARLETQVQVLPLVSTLIQR